MAKARHNYYQTTSRLVAHKASLGSIASRFMRPRSSEKDVKPPRRLEIEPTQLQAMIDDLMITTLLITTHSRTSSLRSLLRRLDKTFVSRPLVMGIF